MLRHANSNLECTSDASRRELIEMGNGMITETLRDRVPLLSDLTVS